MFLSPHFSLAEATLSTTADRYRIDNSKPSAAVILAATSTAQHMEHVRTLLKAAISIGSWIRCLELNRKLGSKDTSQHIKGEAVDFICPKFGTATAVAKKLLAHKEEICFDQLILEHSWIHVSWNSIPGVKQRMQVLSLLNNGSYALGLTSPTGVPL